jgi:thiol-disulfide isomerase/thioredoxin
VTPVRRRSLVIGVVVGLVAGAGAFFLVTRGDDTKLDAHLTGPADTAGGNPGLAQGDAAGKALPELTFTRFDGTTLKLSDLRGKPVVLNLWASNCAPCVQEMPAIERVHEQVKDRVTIIGIDTSDPSRADAKKLATKTGVTYDLAIDQNGQLAQALDFVVLPTTVLVDANGHVVTSHAGALDENRLTDLIDKSFPA